MSNDVQKVIWFVRGRRVRVRGGLKRPIIDSFTCWPNDILSPAISLQGRLARRISAKTLGEARLPARLWSDPEWEEMLPGIFCQVLATDREKDRVSMLVRLVPGADYPRHIHGGIEELYLLDGDLWVDDRKLHAGDYNRAERGSCHERVWSETGCTGVLLTSTKDVLFSEPIRRQTAAPRRAVLKSRVR